MQEESVEAAPPALVSATLCILLELLQEELFDTTACAACLASRCGSCGGVSVVTDEPATAPFEVRDDMVSGDYVRTLALSLMFLFVKQQAARTKRMFKLGTKENI